MFEQEFKQALKYIGADEVTTEKYWSEVLKCYSEKHRFYHTLIHLENLYLQLTGVRNNISHWPVLLFSIAYHDIIYRPSRNNNEEKSSLLAKERLGNILKDKYQLEKCVSQILATKGHSLSDDSDTNYFTDADLSVLGSDSDTYSAYAEAIRKEYRLYPDFLYKPGRIKVLEYFLKLPAIYKTDHFYKKYEIAARTNLYNELKRLQ